MPPMETGVVRINCCVPTTKDRLAVCSLSPELVLKDRVVLAPTRFVYAGNNHCNAWLRTGG